MIVNYFKMSGDELRRIFDVSELKGPEFAKKLGISRSSLYIEFEKARVSREVEEALLKDPNLANKRLLFKIPDTTPSTVEENLVKYVPSDSLLESALGMLNETIRMVSADNKLYRAIVQKAFDDGTLKIIPSKTEPAKR